MPAGWLQSPKSKQQTIMLHAMIQECSQELLQTEIGRKTGIFSLGRKNNIILQFLL